jgi:hypothetical protein
MRFHAFSTKTACYLVERAQRKSQVQLQDWVTGTKVRQVHPCLEWADLENICMTWRAQMKIGIFLRDYVPEHGGCYTFTNEIINMVLRFSFQCSHQFVVFGTNKEPPCALMLSDNTRYVSFFLGIKNNRNISFMQLEELSSKSYDIHWLVLT